MIVIAGHPRTGTSYLVSELSKHPDITMITSDMVGTGLVNSTETEVFIRNKERAWEIIDNLGIDLDYAVEKTPSNSFCVPIISKRAKIIAIVREPSEIIQSMVDYYNIVEVNDLPKAISEYKKFYDALVENRHAIEFYRFEDLHKLPALITKNMGLEPFKYSPPRPAKKYKDLGVFKEEYEFLKSLCVIIE